MSADRVPEWLLKDRDNDYLRALNQYWLPKKDLYSEKGEKFFDGGLIRELKGRGFNNPLWELDLLLFTSWYKVRILPSRWDNIPEKNWRWRANDRHEIIELSQKVLYQSRLSLREGQRSFWDGSVGEWIDSSEDTEMRDFDLFSVDRHHPQAQAGKHVVFTVLYLLGANQGSKDPYEHGVKEKKGFEHLIEGLPTSISGIFAYFGYRDDEQVLGVSFNKEALRIILAAGRSIPPMDGLPDEDRKTLRLLEDLQKTLERRLITGY